MKSGSSGIGYDEKADHRQFRYRRRTGSEELAKEVKEELLKIENVSFVILDQRAAEDAADIAIQKSVRGMDALVMQTAKEYETELVTFDDEMIKKSQTL